MERPGKSLPAEKFRKEGTKNELTVENQLWSQVASVPRNQSDAFRKNPVISLFIWGETSNTLWAMFHGSLLLDLWEDSKIPWALSVWLNPPAVSRHHPWELLQKREAHTAQEALEPMKREMFTSAIGLIKWLQTFVPQHPETQFCFHR